MTHCTDVGAAQQTRSSLLQSACMSFFQVQTTPLLPLARTACRFLHELSCKARVTERILEEYIFVFRLTFLLLRARKVEEKEEHVPRTHLSHLCEKRGGGAPRLSHRVCNVYVPGMERKQVESAGACEREEVCVFDKDKCDKVSENCVSL